jgi:hypothetical protein
MPKNEYIDIKFQSGPVKGKGPNGCQYPDVIDVLINKLRKDQGGRMACRENGMMIMKLEEAKLWDNERTRKRVQQKVEGTDSPHEDK